MSKKLLLADDSITIQKVIGITFAHEDYELIVAGNGDDALAMARESRPDLILADIYMPGKNGYEVCAAIKKDPALRGVPVLLLSGTFEPFDEKKAEASGADSWIAKPFESQALIDRVEDLLANAPQEIPTEMPAASEIEIPDAAIHPGAGSDSGEGGENFADSADLPEIEADMWDELEFSDESDMEFSASDEGTGKTEEEWDGIDDDEGDEMWGGVSLSEEDLGEEDEKEEEDLFVDDDFWETGEDSLAGDEDEFTFDEEPDESFGMPADVEPARPESVSSHEDEEIEGFSEEDILPLDEVDILEEESLETDGWEEAEEEDNFEFNDEEDLSASLQQVETESGGAEMFSFDDEEDAEFDISEDFGEEPEPESADWGFSGHEEESGIRGADEVSPEEVPGTENAAFLSEAAGELKSEEPEAAASRQVEKQVQSMDEEEISRIVEKVAGEVIRKMADTVLEKIAWEVVPDLAESMIRDEIRKIKEEAR